MTQRLTVDRERALFEIAEIEKALAAGHPPPGIYLGRDVWGAIRVVAESLGTSPHTLGSRVGTPDRAGSFKKYFGLSIDWSKYKPPGQPEPTPWPVSPDAVADAAAISPTDPIDLRRERDENARLRNALKEAERRTAEAEAREQSIIGLLKTPLAPQLVMPRSDDLQSRRGNRTVVLHLSDIQYGETVLLEQMDGLNCYDASIAKKRIGRFFSHACDLMTAHWKGAPPDEIVLCLGGDSISGNLHPELEQTNFPTVPETVREVAEHIAGGVILLKKEVGCLIRVYAVPGNHGRLSLKPQSKNRAQSSLDLLVADFAEAITRGASTEGVVFNKAQSAECYFSIYGYHFLLNHGDTMGAKGGLGYIGQAAPITKGHRKLVEISWRVGRPVHFVLTADRHTSMRTAFGFANGSVVGYNEYARDLKADPEPASQDMLVIHPRHGVIRWEPLYLGAPDEGSLYAGPATVVRPLWDGE